MNTLTMIVLATLLGGLLSMVAAAGLAFRLSPRATATLVAFAAGVMLSSALLEILPEAFASLPPHADLPEHAGHAHEAPAASLFAVLLAGLLGVLLLVLYGVGHCGVIVLAGTFSEVVQRYLNWNEKSKGSIILKKVCALVSPNTAAASY